MRRARAGASGGPGQERMARSERGQRGAAALRQSRAGAGSERRVEAAGCGQRTAFRARGRGHPRGAIARLHKSIFIGQLLTNCCLQ